jgi:superfamily II DNA/RNA helicase
MLQIAIEVVNRLYHSENLNELRNQSKSKKIACILAPTRAMVSQLAKEFSTHTTLRIGVFLGNKTAAWEQKKWQKEISKFDV